jgi:hypothetical protein
MRKGAADQAAKSSDQSDHGRVGRPKNSQSTDFEANSAAAAQAAVRTVTIPKPRSAVSAPIRAPVSALLLRPHHRPITAARTARWLRCPGTGQRLVPP